MFHNQKGWKRSNILKCFWDTTAAAAEEKIEGREERAKKKCLRQKDIGRKQAYKLQTHGKDLTNAVLSGDLYWKLCDKSWDVSSSSQGFTSRVPKHFIKAGAMDDVEQATVYLQLLRASKLEKETSDNDTLVKSPTDPRSSAIPVM